MKSYSPLSITDYTLNLPRMFDRIEDIKGIMKLRKEFLIVKARREWGKIYPCGKNLSLTSSFTVYKGALVFWFNTPPLSGQAHENSHAIIEGRE
jgi:hypothetical protein